MDGKYRRVACYYLTREVYTYSWRNKHHSGTTYMYLHIKCC
jgi:hypothetical protein